MTLYDTNLASSQLVEQGLVTTPISQQNDLFQIFPTSVRVKRHGAKAKKPEFFDRSNTQIVNFSSKSRSRLRFVACNSCQPLISQFCLTYPSEFPSDGRLVKSHLNKFLVQLRRIIPDIGYLWIMEFQKRNAPHFHIFLSVPPDDLLRHRLAKAWVKIISPDDEKVYLFHSNPKNWIDWSMGSAQYLAKYLDKESQKFIPPGFYGFGRFWGNSRNIKPESIDLTIEDLDDLSEIDEQTGEIYGGSAQIFRWLGRLAAKQTNGYSKFRQRVAFDSYTMLQGTSAYNQIERYFSKREEVKPWQKTSISVRSLEKKYK